MTAAPSQPVEGLIEPEPTTVAWLIDHTGGAPEVVPSPLTDDTFMDEGDEAWPLIKRADYDAKLASQAEEIARAKTCLGDNRVTWKHCSRCGIVK